MNNSRKLLILHGWGSNSNRWQRVKDLLMEKGIEVWALDLPGFGIEKSPEKAWTRDDYLKWIFQKLEEKGWRQFNLLGHSFGGGLSVKIAALFPEKVEKLILCSPAIIRRKSFKIYFFNQAAYLGKKFFSLPGFKKILPFFQKLLYKLIGTKDYYLAQGVMKEVMKKLAEENLQEILNKIKAFTLIIWGEKDDVLPLKDGYELKKKIKDARLEVIPNVRHAPHREAPEVLAEIICRFL